MKLRHPLTPAWAIATATFRESIRDKFILGITAVGVLITGLSFTTGAISLDQGTRVIQNTGLTAIFLTTLFITIFTTTSSMSRDTERRALYFLFPKPVSRAQYTLGKFLGASILLSTTLWLMTLLFAVGYSAIDRSWTGYSSILTTTLFAWMEMELIAGMALLFATFAAPLNAALYTIGFTVIGHSFVVLQEYLARQDGSESTLKLVDALAVVLPNLEKFSVRDELLHGLGLPTIWIVGTVAYAILYTVFLVFVAARMQRQREV
jgi:ABC-type transport system involved in multi-copper enzyme maturation permease subunit